MKIIILSAIVSLFLFCGHRKDKNQVVTNISDDSVRVEVSGLHQEEEDEEQDWELMDSLRHKEILAEALQLVGQNLDKKTFQKEYVVSSEEGYNIEVKIDLDYHFSKDILHLFVRCNAPVNCRMDIFRVKNQTFENVFYHKEWSITYVGDTIQDINGDGYNDFVMRGYGSSGCCLKGYSLVHLYLPKKMEFSEPYFFLNPTFSPEEHLIRGVCYGHPGQTELYKYKWNGLQVDTLEYVYYEKDEDDQKTGMVIVELDSSYRYPDDSKSVKRLEAVPEEYVGIDGYDWFTGEGYE